MLLAVCGLVGLVAAMVLIGVTVVRHLQRPSATWEALGVRSTYPHKPLPTARIESYYELKEKLRGQYCKGEQASGRAGDSADGGDTWMSSLPAQAKDAIKYKLMQRAIGDMASLQKVDSDARGYWKLFSKGVVSKTFWTSVVEAERELSAELASVKAEASRVEPTQDPQGIITEAMQFVVRYGDKMPSSADVTSAADTLAELMRHMPPPGAPGALPPLPPGMMLPGSGHPGFAPQATPPPMGGGDDGDAYKWKQDSDEVEISIAVPSTATKADVKVVIQAKALKVEHRGEAIVMGTLASICCPEGSTWTLNKGRVVVSLEKAAPRPWPALFKT